MIGVFFMPSLFIHFVTTFLNRPKSTKFYLFNYALSILFTMTVYTPLYGKNPTGHLVFPYWLHPGPIFHFAISHFAIIVVYSFWLMFKELRKAKGVFRNQLMYVFIGTGIGYFGGSTNYFCWYRIPIPPFLNACVAFYVGFVTYAIVRYRLLDIHFVIRKSLVNTIGAIVLTMTLLPLFLVQSAILKSVIIFFTMLLTVIYLPKIKRKAEDAVTQILYKEKYRYQERLEDFIEKIMSIPEENKLLKDTTSALAKNLGVVTVAVFTQDTGHRDYLLRTQVGLDKLRSDFRLQENGLTKWLRKYQTIFVKEEMEKALKREEFIPIHEVMAELSASVCMPVMLKDDLVGFITLGEKSSGEMYSHIDIGILHRLGTMFATALNYKKMEAKLREQEAVEYIMIMAKELSHQLRNRLVATNTYFHLLPERQNDPTFREEFTKVAMRDIDAISRKLTELMFFANLEKPRPKYSPMEKMIESALLLNQQGTVEKNIEIHKDLEKNLPQIFVDEELITSSISNFLDNATGAVPETGGKIEISVSMLHDITKEMEQKSTQWIRIVIKDNGRGMGKETLENIFKPFFTTRSGGTEALKMGFGLGLVTSKMIIEAHGGNIRIDSEENKGTTVIINLPVSNKDLLEGNYLPPEGVAYGKP